MTILQFDPYVIGTWVDRGLAVAVPAKEPAKDEQPKPGKRFARAFAVRSVVQASVVAVGMALTDLPFVSTGFGVADVIKVTESAAMYEAADDEVPASRWASLVALLRDSAELPADDMRGDPAPLG